MYIIDRNHAERATYSSFDESVLRKRSEAVFWALAFLATAGVVGLLIALAQGASPLALLLAGVFFLALASSKK